MSNELNNTGQNKGLRNTPTTRVSNKNYRDGWDKIFGKKEKASPLPEEPALK